MSYAGSGGGRTRMGTKVFLNVYDLSPANDVLYAMGLGLHHSGVEIMGTEYSFASGAGIFEAPPKVAPGARFREQVELGAFEGGQSELRMALTDLRGDGFGPEDYHLLRKNCNHFANVLVWRLLKRQIPGHVNRLADIGVCCSCLLPKKLLEHSPVGDPNDKSHANFGYTTFRPANRSSSGTATSSQSGVFQGSGNTLGGSSLTSSAAEREGLLGRWTGAGSSSSSNKKNGQDDLTDRREKARKAALARLEAGQKQEN